MAKDRKRARDEDTARPAPEPGIAARLLAEYYSTLMTIGAVITVLTAWVIWDKTNIDGATIPAPLYVYLAIGLGLLGATALARHLLLAEPVEIVNRRRRSLKDARALLKETRRVLRKSRARLDARQLGEVTAARDALTAARDARDWDRIVETLAALDRKLDEQASGARKSQIREYIESIVLAVTCALLLRAFVIEAFKIPSGSMIPTLQVGDHIFVNKFLYGIRLPWPLDETEFGQRHPKFLMGIRKPHRGEVIVFKYPKDPDKDFIKRIVAVEGDTIEIKNNVPWVNDQPIPRTKIDGACEYDDFEELSGRWEHKQCLGYREEWGGHQYTTLFDRGGVEKSWPKVTVPTGTVFVMGDNRDNSHDSRYWGTVPFELIKGKAMVIWWSSGEPEGIRVKRMGHLVE